MKGGQVNMTGVVDLFVAERKDDLVEYFRSAATRPPVSIACLPLLLAPAT